ncbi:MAG TPA: isocitrate lyase/phosphoenolpyruvate mutase family protein [Micromonospora sp.]|nr:isocitrate lyase/phosphoenolpyruvate mutase family protein [Micromonospora sp.]
MSASTTSTDACNDFHALHHSGTPLLLPNAWDYASAAILVNAGFGAIGTTSLGVAAAHGLRDGQGAARAETVALTRRLARLPCRLTVDIEAGFSTDPGEVAQLAAELAAIGAVGINLEDGRPDGTLASISQQQELIATIKSQVPNLFLNARTDVHWLALDDPQMADTLARVEAYRAAGADGIFVPGLADDDRIRTVVTSTDAPVNILYLPGQHTVGRLAELGVRRISYGSLLFRTAIAATAATALAVARGEPLPEQVPSYVEVNQLAR